MGPRLAGPVSVMYKEDLVLPAQKRDAFFFHCMLYKARVESSSEISRFSFPIS